MGLLLFPGDAFFTLPSEELALPVSHLQPGLQPSLAPSSSPEQFGGSLPQLWAQLCPPDTPTVLLTPSFMVHHCLILPFRDYPVLLHKQKYPKKSLGFAPAAVFLPLMTVLTGTHYLQPHNCFALLKHLITLFLSIQYIWFMMILQGFFYENNTIDLKILMNLKKKLQYFANWNFMWYFLGGCHMRCCLPYCTLMDRRSRAALCDFFLLFKIQWTRMGLWTASEHGTGPFAGNKIVKFVWCFGVLQGERAVWLLW